MKEVVQKVLGKFGYTICRTSTLHGHDPASVTRPVGELNLFLEDIRARHFVPRGIIDVGANKGEWTRTALSIFPNTPALMIEPQEEMEVYLSAVTKTSANCHYIKAGAGRTPGELMMSIGENPEGSTFLPPTEEQRAHFGEQRKTRIVTLDSVLAQDYPQFKPDLVKVDVQGFEIEVLSGAETLFGRTELFILEVSLFEFMPKQPIAREVMGFMSARGYELYDVPGHCRRPHDGALGQLDLAFVKANGFFRKTSVWE